MRTRERVLLATLAVASLTILTGATASAATTTEVPASTQSPGTFAGVTNGTTIRLAVHTTGLVGETSSADSSVSTTATATATAIPEAVDAPNDTPSATSADSTVPAKAGHLATARTPSVGTEPQVSAVSAILANSQTGRRAAGRGNATDASTTSGLDVSAAVADPANRGGIGPSSSANRRTATSGAVVRC